MTPQDDTTRYLPTPDNDVAPCPATPASVTDAARAHPHQTHQNNSIRHRDTTTWHASDNARAQSRRTGALPTLPQSPSRLQRRWHLTPDDAMPTQMAQPQPKIPAILRQRSPPATQPAPHAAQTDTLSLAAQMMAQESPITEQGPPANNIDSLWINGAPGMEMSPADDS